MFSDTSGAQVNEWYLFNKMHIMYEIILFFLTILPLSSSFSQLKNLQVTITLNYMVSNDY